MLSISPPSIQLTTYVVHVSHCPVFVDDLFLHSSNSDYYILELFSQSLLFPLCTSLLHTLTHHLLAASIQAVLKTSTYQTTHVLIQDYYLASYVSHHGSRYLLYATPLEYLVLLSCWLVVSDAWGWCGLPVCAFLPTYASNRTYYFT